MKISGTFNGTGALLYLGIGFVPSAVRVVTCESADEAILEWSRNNRGAETLGGLAVDDDGAISPVVAAAGIIPYRGGDKMTALATAYLVKDPAPDKRGVGTMGMVRTWTLQTSGNKTGKFNVGVNTSYVGEGSEVRVWDPIQRTIHDAILTALTNDGDADDEVTLVNKHGHGVVPSGEVWFLSGMYDYVGAAEGVIVPAGFAIAAAYNASGEMYRFEAELHD